MPDDKPCEGVKEEAINKSSEGKAIHPPPPVNEQLGTDAQRVPGQDVRGEVHTIEDQLKQAERLMIYLTAAIALFALCSVVVGYFQWRVMDGQLKEMKAGGQGATDQTNALIGNMNWLARTMDGALKQTRIATEASDRQSKVSLDASITAARSDQRAWLGAGDNTYTITETGLIESSVSVLNSGKSPALNILCTITGTTKPKGYALTDSDIVYPSDLPILKQGTIFPNQHFPLKAGGPPMESRTQKRWFENVQSGDFIQYFFGYVRYKDAFGRAHWTHFCTQFVPATKSGTPCPVYNDTDDSKRK